MDTPAAFIHARHADRHTVCGLPFTGLDSAMSLTAVSCPHCTDRALWSATRNGTAEDRRTFAYDATA